MSIFIQKSQLFVKILVILRGIAFVPLFLYLFSYYNLYYLVAMINQQSIPDREIDRETEEILLISTGSYNNTLENQIIFQGQLE